MALRRTYIAALHDIIMAAASFICAMFLRLGDDFHLAYDYLILSTGIFTAVCVTVFTSLGLYKGMWRYASIPDLVAIAKAATLATLIFIPILFMLTRLEEFPRSVLIINWTLLLIFLGGPRFMYRVLRDGRVFSFDHSNENRIKILLVGLSDSALHFIRETQSSKLSEYKIVGIIDENRESAGRHIHNVKIYGDLNEFDPIIAKLKRENNAPQRVIIGHDHADGNLVRQLMTQTEKFGLTVAKLPRITEFKNHTEKTEIQPIAIEDLLGRSPKIPTHGARSAFIKDKVIMVTGSGGTIGGELVRQLARYQPKHLILVENSEYNLYAIEQDLQTLNVTFSYETIIADVRNLDALEHIFSTTKPEVIYHAAALKHVPLVEQNIIEAAFTNIIGSKNVADMCIKYGAEKMVMISTDKAVNPSSLMGVTKRVAEEYIQSLGNSNQNHTTDFATVRFGNVLGSSGSVIPLFQSQLEKGGPLTITHPDMTRYFMTVPEAVELVLLASTLSSQHRRERSAIYVLDMGEPIKIKDVAVQMIKLAGLRPDEDIHISYTGIRPGEKLYEELFYHEETVEKTEYDSIMQAWAKPNDTTKLNKLLATLTKHCHARQSQKVVDTLLKLVPQYQAEPNN